MEFIHIKEQTCLFYKSISIYLKIYALNDANMLNIEDFINHNHNNFSQYSGFKIIEGQQTYIILKDSSDQFL